MYRRKRSRPSPRKINAKRQNGCQRNEALQTAEKRREAKVKGRKERHTHLNAELQIIARRDKKAFLSISAKKLRKTAELERLESSSRKLEIPREHFMQRWAQSRTEMVWT